MARAEMRQLRFAFSFLTIVPMGPRDLQPDESLSGTRAYFPLVGLFVGVGLVALDMATRAIMAPLLAAAIVVVAWIVSTRALHLDGLMDTVDAAFGAYSRERRLEIMHDPQFAHLALLQSCQ